MATLTDAPPRLRGGLRAPDPQLELYPVAPGGVTAVALEEGDRVTVIDRHGGQVAEVSVLNGDSGDDAPALGLPSDAPATLLRSTLAGGGANRYLAALHARGLDPHDPRCARLFGNDSAPGESVTLQAARAATLVVAAPAGRLVDGDPPGSELLVEIRR